MTDLIKKRDDEYWTQISHLVEENNIDLKPNESARVSVDFQKWSRWYKYKFYSYENTQENNY